MFPLLWSMWDVVLASGNWREIGVFNVNNTLVVELNVQYQIRNGVQAGNGVMAWPKPLLVKQFNGNKKLRIHKNKARGYQSDSNK